MPGVRQVFIGRVTGDGDQDAFERKLYVIRKRVEAQTLANAYLAIDAGHEIIPVLNKIDLPAAEPDRISYNFV